MEFIDVERKARSCCANVRTNEYHGTSNHINFKVVLCQKEESMFRNQFPINSYDIQQARYLLMVIVGIKLWLEPIWHRSTIGLHGHPALSTDVRLEYWAVLTSLCLLDALTIKRVRWFGDIMMKICVLLRSSAEKAGIMSVMSYLLTLGRTGE